MVLPVYQILTISSFPFPTSFGCLASHHLPPTRSLDLTMTCFRQQHENAPNVFKQNLSHLVLGFTSNSAVNKFGDLDSTIWITRHMQDPSGSATAWVYALCIWHYRRECHMGCTEYHNMKISLDPVHSVTQEHIGLLLRHLIYWILLEANFSSLCIASILVELQNWGNPFLSPEEKPRPVLEWLPFPPLGTISSSEEISLLPLPIGSDSFSCNIWGKKTDPGWASRLWFL